MGVYDDRLIICKSLHLNHNDPSLVKLAKVGGRANQEFSHPSTNTGRQDKASALSCVQRHANATAVTV